MSLFDDACLIQLRTSCWTGMKKLPQLAMSKLENAEPGWLQGKKHLVDPEYLDPIKAVLQRARKMLGSKSLPFPVNSLHLVPKESIVEIERYLQEVKIDFDQAVDWFVANYETARQEAVDYLGAYFSGLDYPLDIRNKFRMEWRFVTLSVPGKASVLPAALYETEKAKFKDLMDETREMSMIALRQEFAGLVAHLVGRLSETEGDKPKMLRTGTFERLQEFLDGFSARNLFDDHELSDIINQTRDIISGVDIDCVKSDHELKSKLSEEISDLKDMIDKSIVDLPRRKIRYHDEVIKIDSIAA